jgi:hypothetical protein
MGILIILLKILIGFFTIAGIFWVLFNVGELLDKAQKQFESKHPASIKTTQNVGLCVFLIWFSFISYTLGDGIFKLFAK